MKAAVFDLDGDIGVDQRTAHAVGVRYHVAWERPVRGPAPVIASFGKPTAVPNGKEAHATE
jgi:hypothetical protein